MGLSLQENLNKTRYRYLICNQYIIFYIFENDTINIMRILHGKRDYLKILDL